MAEYKGMIARNPDIGSIKTNPLLPGLYLAAYALAFHKAYPEYIGGEELGKMTDLLVASDTMKKLYEGKDFFSEKNISSRSAMAKEPAEKAHECEYESLLYEHGTHFAFPQSMLDIMIPVIGNLFVGLAFKAGRKHPKECKQTRLDIDRRISAAILKW